MVRTWLLFAALGCAGAVAACAQSPLPPASPPAPASPGLRSAGNARALTGDLLYVVSTSGNVFLFSYPSGKFSGEFTIAPGVSAWGACAGSSGDIFITVDLSSKSSAIYEYAHGATTPLAVLRNDGNLALDCAGDPTTGSLAVVSVDAAGKSNIAIYQHARSNPKRYYDSKLNFEFCGYDDRGDLFAVASGSYQLAELASGAKSFKGVPLDKELIMPGGIVWDGTDLAIRYANFEPRYSGIARIALSDGKAKVIGNVPLEGLANRGSTFVIEDGSLLDPGGQSLDQVGMWEYPAGGKVIKILRARHANGQTFYGIALSVASKR